MTKREARASALAKLRPHPGALLWDVGAGCGSVAIEWMRAAEHARGDRHRAGRRPPRHDRGENAVGARRAAISNILDGRAPERLARPARARTRCSSAAACPTRTIDASLAALQPGGRLVAHAVTLESEALLLAAYADMAASSCVSRCARRSAATEPVGDAVTGWRPAMPVTQWSWTKRA